MSRAERRAVRREQLILLAHSVAEVATHRRITLASRPIADHEVRHALGQIIRRWSRYVPVTYTTADAARTDWPAIEHIVPVRALVDRILMQPSDTERLLDEGVVLATVTPAEHDQLGKLWRDHRELYAAMLEARPEELVSYGLRRYTKTGVKLRRLNKNARG
jgi:hypothetical protein